VVIALEPGDRGSGMIFENKIIGGAIRVNSFQL